METKPIFKAGLKQMTHIDFGISEDEFNNFLIDLWRPGGLYDQAMEPKSGIPNPSSRETVPNT